MRQKKLKNVTKELMHAQGVVTEIKKIESKQNIHLEIGSGKGQFITSLAKDNPEILFVALEMNMSVCYRILEKKLEQNLDNLVIILGDANHLLEYFDMHSIDQIYLNFSDPWPKKKQHKRRLTFPSFLSIYEKLLKKGGKIQFRTDHKTLFEDSVEYIQLSRFQLISRNDALQASKYMTEYEVKKRLIGPIYQLIAEVEDVKESI